MMSDLLLFSILCLSFGAVATIIFVFGQYYWTQRLALRRLPMLSTSAIAPSKPILRGFDGIVLRFFSNTRLGTDEAFREQLRRNLRKAGYFGPDAVALYVIGKLGLSVSFAAIAYLLAAFFSDLPLLFKAMVMLIAAIFGYFGADVFLARRRRTLIKRFRLSFPNVLDLLVVCVDAGLTLEIAFDRVRAEVLKQDREFGFNLEMMGAEMRAGRSMIEALDTLSDRLGLEEAESFVSILRQSIELGSDVSEALRVFSDEMRDKRLLRAEEAANKLSVKMVLPLGLFIFPVVLLVVLLPVMIKLMTVLH
jgi:tight adherence protein C